MDTITVLGSSIYMDITDFRGSIGHSHQNGPWQKHSYRQSGWSQAVAQAKNICMTFDDTLYQRHHGSWLL